MAVISRPKLAGVFWPANYSAAAWDRINRDGWTTPHEQEDDTLGRASISVAHETDADAGDHN